MAQCKGSAQDFIQDAFSPTVAVLCSHDAELICQKNNLSFVELVQPFCRINTEAHIRDPGGVSHTIHNLRINMCDMNLNVPQNTLVKKMLNEAVSAALPQNYESPRNSVISVGAYDLQLSSSTPWFEAFRECFLQVSYPSDHEFLKHFVACIFVVSSSHADPMDQFVKLTQQQHLQQHQQPTKIPRWFCPNILRYYVLVHDVMEEEGSKGEAVYQSMKSTYGINNCHLLHINSRSPHAPDNMPTEQQGSMPDPWSQFMPRKQDSNDTSLDVLGGTDTCVFPGHVQEGQPSSFSLPQSQSMVSLDEVVDSAFEVTEETENQQPSNNMVIDHPLAPDVNTNHTDNFTNDPTATIDTRGDNQNNNPPVVPDPSQTLQNSTDKPRPSGHGGCLTLSDHDRLRIFVHEFMIRGLIPWAERTLRNLNDQVTSRKGIHRSFLNISKKWFVGKPTGQTPSAEKTNIIYTPEAPEMQMRRLADLAFMFQLYEIAYQTYHAAKKEFNSEHAWLHFAGALEMACMSVFMQGNNSQRQYPSHYMETAITTYLNSCKSTQFSTRATLLSTEALKSKNLYTEAALQFIKMTSEDSDLRSALLLEQAAHCFIKMKQPMVRKYSFHMILAGHRFSKAGQRRHALRSYSQALQVYKGKDWTLAEDHINFTIGRQSFNLKQLENSTAAFKHLLCAESRQSPPQQNAFLREYLFVFKQQLNQYSPDGSSSGILSGELPQLPLPMVDGNSTKVLCVEGPRNREDGKTAASSIDFSSDESDNATWQKLEEIILISHKKTLPMGFQSSIACYTNKTVNLHNPVCILGEPVTVEVQLNNPLRVPLVLGDLVLLWKFLPVKYDQENEEKVPSPISNEQALASVKNHLAEELVESQVLPEVILQGRETKCVRLYVIAQATGELHITGLAYNLGTNSQTQPSLTEESSNTTKPSFIAAINIRGKAILDVQGPRLNNTKEEKASKMYGPDRRLDLIIVPKMPKLEVCFSEFPETLMCGQVQQIVCELKNCGDWLLQDIQIACTLPEFFAIGSAGEGAVSDKSGIYPTLVNTSDSDSEEHPVDCPVVKFVVTVELPDGRLDAGQTISLPMWVRGPAEPGKHSVHFMFYYEPLDSNSKPKHRVVHHKSTLMVHQSISLRACASRAQDVCVAGVGPRPDAGPWPDAGPPPVQDVCVAGAGPRPGTGPPPVQDLVISLEINNTNNIQNSSITEFSILQVSCVSCNWHLCHLSTRRHSDLRISSGESSLICLRATRCRHTRATKSRSRVFTNVTFDQHQIDSAASPCSDFFFHLKLQQTFEQVEVEQSKQHKLAPELAEKTAPFQALDKATELDLTLIVLWKAFVVEESGPCSVIHGQHHISLSQLGAQVWAPAVSKMAAEQPPMKIMKEPEDPGPPVPKAAVTGQLLKYHLKYRKEVLHHFSNKLCKVNVRLRVHNCSDSCLEVQVNTSPGDSVNKPETGEVTSEAVMKQDELTSPPRDTNTHFTWAGRGSTTINIEPGCTIIVPLLACFTHSGVYDLSHIEVLARPLEKISGIIIDWIKQKSDCTNLIVVRNQGSDSISSRNNEVGIS